MANDSKKVSELTIATTVSANDRVVVLTSPNTTSAAVKTITVTNLVAAYLPTYSGVINSSSQTIGSIFIANSTQLTFTPNTFNFGTVSKTSNGYVWLPNGVLNQWGTVSANSTTGNATFSIAFPTACRAVTLSVVGSANVAYQLASPNSTVTTIRTSSTTTAIDVQYIAIGY
jgi:hypothetical protein